MSAFDDYLGAPAAQNQGQSFDAYLNGGDSQTPGGIPIIDATNQPAPPADPNRPIVDISGTSTSKPAQTIPTQPGYLASLGASLGHGFGSTMLGAQQLLGHTFKSMGGIGETPTLSSLISGQRTQNFLGNAGDWLINDANQGLKNLDAQAAPYDKAHPVVSTVGNFGGQMAALAPTMLVGPEYAALSTAGKIGMGAAQGGVASLLMPTDDSNGNYWGNKAVQTGVGTALGGAMPAAIAGGKAIGNTIWDTLKPAISPEKYVGEGLTNMLAPQEAATVASNIRSAPTFVPGSNPTTAQVARNPLLVQTEKAAGNIPDIQTGLLQRAIDNNQARWNSLMNVAKTPEDLQAAIANRADVTQPLYDAAADQTANVGVRSFNSLFQRPAVVDAMKKAEQMALNRNESIVFPQPGGDRAISGRALDYTKQALSDMITDAQARGQNSNAAAMSDALNKLNQWTLRYIPDQRVAARQFAAMSPPISDMQVGQQIANTLGTNAMNANGIPNIAMMPFKNAFKSAVKAQQYGITPETMQALQGIGQDLQRATISNSVKSPGSDTAYNIAANGWLARQLYGNNFQGATGLGKGVAAGVAALSGHPLAGAGLFAGGNKLGQMVGNRLNQKLGGLLLDPKAILPYLDSRAAFTPNSVPNPLTQGLLNYGRPALVNAITGAGFQKSNAN